MSFRENIKEMVFLWVLFLLRDKHSLKKPCWTFMLGKVILKNFSYIFRCAVYCEVCVISPNNEVYRCQICRSVHPNGLPKVCLVLEHFLEEHFSEEYTARKEAVLKQADCCCGSPSTSMTSFSIIFLWIDLMVYFILLIYSGPFNAKGKYKLSASSLLLNWLVGMKIELFPTQLPWK